MDIPLHRKTPVEKLKYLTGKLIDALDDIDAGAYKKSWVAVSGVAVALQLLAEELEAKPSPKGRTGPTR